MDRGKKDIRMHDKRRMVHSLLQSPIDMGKPRRRAAKPHPFAQIVPSFFAIGAVATRDARLDSDALADAKVRVGDSHARAESCDGARRFMAQH